LHHQHAHTQHHEEERLHFGVLPWLFSALLWFGLDEWMDGWIDELMNEWMWMNV